MKTTAQKTSTRKLSFTKRIILFFINLFFSLILAAFMVQFFPPVFLMNVQIDLFLFFIGFFILLQFGLVRYIKRFVFLIYPIIVTLILVSSLIGVSWNVKTIYQNAENNINQLFNTLSSQVEIKPALNAVAPHISLQQRIQQRVNHKDSSVRMFAVQHSLVYFDEYYFKFGQICRQLSLIKYIKDNYKYVRDPNGFDYFAPPQESIVLMAGDCDDYSILMASTLKAIGADVRIIWAPSHVYPELYCGNQKTFDKYASAIYSFFEKEIGEKKIYYRLDKNGDYWINIDYTDIYPGSSYYSEEVLSIIYIK